MYKRQAVCSVTDTPPTVLVCLNRNSRVRDRFRVDAAMCINVLGAEQKDISGVFASSLEQAERFRSGHWDTLTTGAPVLEEAVLSLDCRIERIVEVGTHSVMCGAVESVRSGSARGGLVYFNRTYHMLPHTDE